MDRTSTIRFPQTHSGHFFTHNTADFQNYLRRNYALQIIPAGQVSSYLLSKRKNGHIWLFSFLYITSFMVCNLHSILLSHYTSLFQTEPEQMLKPWDSVRFLSYLIHHIIKTLNQVDRPLMGIFPRHFLHKFLVFSFWALLMIEAFLK